MVSISMTEAEAQGVVDTLRYEADRAAYYSNAQVLKLLAERIQEQLDLEQGNWFEFPAEGHYSTREKAQADIEKTQRLFPKHEFRIAPSVVWPGYYTFWTQGRKD
jgi:hypothetical protein